MPGGDGEPTVTHAGRGDSSLCICMDRQSGTPKVGVHNGLDPGFQPGLVQSSHLHGVCWVLLTWCAWYREKAVGLVLGMLSRLFWKREAGQITMISAAEQA